VNDLSESGLGVSGCVKLILKPDIWLVLTVACPSATNDQRTVIAFRLVSNSTLPILAGCCWLGDFKKSTSELRALLVATVVAAVVVVVVVGNNK